MPSIATEKSQFFASFFVVVFSRHGTKTQTIKMSLHLLLFVGENEHGSDACKEPGSAPDKQQSLNGHGDAERSSQNTCLSETHS